MTRPLSRAAHAQGMCSLPYDMPWAAPCKASPRLGTSTYPTKNAYSLPRQAVRARTHTTTPKRLSTSSSIRTVRIYCTQCLVRPHPLAVLLPRSHAHKPLHASPRQRGPCRATVGLQKHLSLSLSPPQLCPSTSIEPSLAPVAGQSLLQAAGASGSGGGLRHTLPRPPVASLLSNGWRCELVLAESGVVGLDLCGAAVQGGSAA